MRFLLPLASLGLASVTVIGCSSSSAEPAKDAGGADTSISPSDAGSDAPTVASCDGGSCIQHVVILVQENHTFDTHFGGYCTAAPGSNPTCNIGPACCEKMPATDPSGTKPTVLTDAEEAAYDPNHTEACEVTEIDNGAMDGYAESEGGASSGCGDPRNVAISDPSVIQPYWALAGSNAIADRYFQPTIGQSSSNDMFLARGTFVFTDNDDSPENAIGVSCEIIGGTPSQFTDKTIGDLLTAASVPWTFFADGYGVMESALDAGACPDRPADCPFAIDSYPCLFDPSDVPFSYYPTTRDNPANMKDFSAFTSSLSDGTLPAVSFIKAIGYKQEHPGYGSTLSAGVAFATGVISSVESSPYASSTLVLLTYDEGGGFFDHVAPPAANAFDNKPYGTRIPLMAVGPFARKNFVSHVVMEHSSLVKFIEWNFLGQTTGQLGARDTNVNNIGSLLDPDKTGIPVPEN